VTFRYAAFDLDGTLLAANLTVTDDTVAGLRRLRRLGISLVVASGRSPRLVTLLGLPSSLLAEFEPIMVLRDGDLLWNWRTDRILVMRTVPPAVVPVLTAHRFPDFVVDTGRHIVATSRRAVEQHSICYHCPKWSITVSDRPPAAPAAKVTVYADPPDVIAALRGIDGCTFSATPHDRRCSVVPAGSCKTAGMTRLMAGFYRERGLTRVVAFGDGGNDACLLGCAGAGVAMAVANPGAMKNATIQLTGSLADYLNDEFPDGLTARKDRRCEHQP